ncbi:lysoplasmalogenase [Corynebacterium sp. A21]|uniref:lysoplasmalogenase n=1 Tax=Corynebacterium sp. A21 TaxID=3457318 RepID=UPI003FD3981D
MEKTERSLDMAGIYAAVLKRSTEGAVALSESLRRATREPERAGYLAFAELNSWSSLFRWKKLKAATKPALLPLLAGRILRSELDTSAKTIGLLGLSGGCFGDVVLLRPDRLPLGAAGFAFNHLAYSWLLWQRGARPTVARAAGRALPLVFAIGLTAWRKPQLLPITAGYGSLLATVSVLGDDRALIRADAPSSLGIGHGGNLFLLSDALLISRELLFKEDSFSARILDAMVMDTYTIAQLLLVDGLFPAELAQPAARSRRR